MRSIARIGIALLLVVCCSCDWFVNEEALKKQAKAYIDEVLPRIITSWDSKQLLWNSHPEFLKKTPPEQLDQLFFLCMKLGPLKKYDQSQGRISISKLTVDDQTGVFCDYITQLDFENSSATINVKVVKEAGQWSILSFLVESDLLKETQQKTAVQEENEEKEEPLSREQLDELIQKQLANDTIPLRRNVDKVFALAEMYEKESKDEKAIDLYEKALQADPANLSNQLSLARLLMRHDRINEGVSRLRYVYEFAEDDGLLLEARNLLSSARAESAESVARQDAKKNIEIVLVPMGKPSGQIMSELRSALQDKLGVAVSISENTIDPGGVDRRYADLLISRVFNTVQQRLNRLQRDLIMQEFKIADGDLNSPQHQAHFIRAVLKKSGTQGHQALQRFENDLEKTGDSGQYNIIRLANEIRKVFPVDGKETVKAYLGVTSVDLYMSDSNFLYGGSEGIYGVISYHQFRAAHNGAKQCRPLVVTRLLKQALSTSNFIFGIPRCNNPYCARSFPFGLAEHDAKSDKLCHDCLERLQAYLKDPLSYAMATELLNRAVFFSKVENNNDKAIEFYQKALENKPDFELAYEYMGLTYEKQGQREKSMACFQKALELSPGSVPAHLYLGNHYLGSRELQQAIAHYLKVLEKAPENASVHEGLGKAYHQLKQWDRAIEHLEYACKLNSKSAPIHALLGLTYFEMGKSKEAIDSFLKAVEIDPNLYATHFNLGVLFMKTGQKDRAIEQYKKEIEINPSYFNPYVQLGSIYLKDRLLDDSASMFKAALAIKPEDANSWNDLGYTYYLKKNYREAIEQYEKCLKIDPSRGLTHYNKAKAHFAQSQFGEAVQEYDKAADLSYPGSPQFRESLEPYRN